MTYRAEIDGIRAIAVMSVILYHAGYSLAGAGYAGVDVFFVISGYLIGGQILDELENGSFSFRKFYLRRARRILPALYLVILVSAVVGAFVMMPRDYRYFGGAALSTLLFASNIWFMERIDYFNPEAAQDPLVHTWSLGIEEQFYLLAPVVLFLLWRYFKSGLGPGVWLLFLGSLTAAVMLSESHPESSFYLLHTRAWELLAGVLVARFLRTGQSHILSGQQTALRVAAWLGLAFLLLGVGAIPEGSPWPGAWTLLPVMGTVLLLLCGNEVSGVRHLLSWPPARFVGLISYSAYLWHQPAFSFLELSGKLPQDTLGSAILIGVILLISTVSWRFVELPFRRLTLPRPRGRAALWSAALLIVAFAVGGHLTKGYPKRMSPEVLEILAFSDSYGPNYERCVRSRVHVPAWEVDEACIHGEARPVAVALWGDSHAARLADPLGDALSASGISMAEYTVTSCLPVPTLINFGQTRAQRCPEFNGIVRDHLVESDQIKTVILFANWDNYFSRDGTPNLHGYISKDGAFFTYPVGAAVSIPENERTSAIVEALRGLLLDLTEAGKRVVLVASLPKPGIRVPEYVANLVWHGETVPDRSGYPREYFDLQSKLSRSMISETVTGLDGVEIVLPEDRFCDEVECLFVKDGRLLYTDGNHPSLDGSALIVPLISKAVNACEMCGSERQSSRGDQFGGEKAQGE